MPIYEYKCKKCGHISEFLERFDSKADHQCEKCGHDILTRVMSVFSANSEGKGITGGGGDSCSSCSDGSCSLCNL